MFDEGYFDVQIFTKNFELTEPLRKYLDEKVNKMQRLTDSIIYVAIRLELHRLEHTVNIGIKFANFRINVHATTVDMYSAIDKAFEKLDHKMRRWKERIQDHQAKKTAVVDMRINVLKAPEDPTKDFNVEIEEQNIQELEDLYFPSKVVKTKTRALKMLTLEEAIMKMELSGDHFLIFRAEEDQELKVIYRRRDGSYGVIIPES